MKEINPELKIKTLKLINSSTKLIHSPKLSLKPYKKLIHSPKLSPKAI